MNTEKIITNINTFWDDKITPTLVDYIKIPKFYYSYSQKCYDSFYNKANLLRDRQVITAKSISNLQ